MRHRTFALPTALVAALALFALASTALAGGWATVSAQNVPVDPPAGEETTISLRMLQHGMTPVSWPKLTVLATEKTSGVIVAATAVASGPEGRYTVKLTFPTEGQWTLSYSSQDLMMEGSAIVTVAQAAAAAPVTTPATQAEAVVLPLLAVLAIFVVLAVGVLLLRRGTPAGTRVSAGT